MTTDVPQKCEEASSALSLAIFGIFCCGIILAPIAISKANKAEKLIAENPNLEGAGKAQAAKIIAIISLILWGIGILVKLSQMSQM